VDTNGKAIASKSFCQDLVAFLACNMPLRPANRRRKSVAKLCETPAAILMAETG
jgi:hypothetical protein